MNKFKLFGARGWQINPQIYGLIIMKCWFFMDGLSTKAQYLNEDKNLHALSWLYVNYWPFVGMGAVMGLDNVAKTDVLTLFIPTFFLLLSRLFDKDLHHVTQSRIGYF